MLTNESSVTMRICNQIGDKAGRKFNITLVFGCDFLKFKHFLDEYMQKKFF